MAKPGALSIAEPKRGLQLEAHQVVIRPLVTEKGTHLIERYNTYLFQVHSQATKAEIKVAVEALFDVSVVGVRTIKRKGKPRRYKQRLNYRSDVKRALVKLAENERIALF
ncbi:50S ribosomal protein L23 [bacterium]|jgi:large subunit ribosomal protein L23|nr:50S ribosomal protein L23 [bacterium]